MNIDALWYTIFFGWLIWAVIAGIQDNRRNKK